MNRTICRLIAFCSVILSIMLFGNDISFAGSHNMKLEAAHVVPGEDIQAHDAAAPMVQSPSTRESAFEWVVSALVLSSILLIMCVLTMSAVSMLPAPPQAETTSGKKQAARDNSGDGIRPMLPGPAKNPVLVNVFSFHVLTLPPAAGRKV